MDPVTWIAAMAVVLGGWYVVDLGRRQLRSVEETVAELLDGEQVTEPDPPRGRPIVDEAVRAGFERVTSLRQPIGEGTLISTVCATPDGILLDVSWSEDPGSPQPGVGLCSVLDVGDAILTTQTLAHLPAADVELRQTFPDGDLATLLARHREALAWLAGQGIEARPLTPERAVDEFRRWTRASGQFATEARWPTGVGIWWRQRRGSHLDVGPLAQHHDVDERLEALGRGPAGGADPV